MTRSIGVLIGVLCLLLGGVYWLRLQVPEFNRRLAEQAQRQASLLPASASPSALLTPVESAMTQLTPRQKVLQTIALPVLITNSQPVATETAAFLLEDSPGVITVFGEKISRQTAISVMEELRKMDQVGTGVRPLIAVDHEGGVVQRLSGQGFTKLSSWESWCQSDSDQKKQSVVASAGELQELGIQIVFAPVVDVATASSFLKTRACSLSAPHRIVQAEEWGSIFAQHRILPVIKHYPGIGHAKKDPHVTSEVVTLDKEQQAVFATILSDFPQWGVMTAHSGEVLPCSIDEACLTQLREFAPRALVFSDGLEMKALTGTLSEKSLAAMTAGNDVLVFGRDVSVQQIQEVVDVLSVMYVQDIKVKTAIDRAVQQVLTYKQMFMREE